jgi:hypothetical protein
MSHEALSLRMFLHRHGRLPPVQAALFAAGIADQLAACHAGGRSWGPLNPDTLHVDVRGQRPHALLARPAQPHAQVGGCTPADDVRAMGLLLAGLLGAGAGEAPRPAGVPDVLWAPVADCLATEPDAQPPAAQLARRFRQCARDLLLTGDLTGGPEPPEPASAPAYLPGPPPPAAPANRSRRRGSLLVVSATAASIVLALVGITFAVTRQGFPLSTTRAAATAPAPPATPAPQPRTESPAPAQPTAGAPPPPPAPGGQPPPAPPPPAPPPPQNAPPQTTERPPAGPPTTSACAPDGCPARATFVAQGDHLDVCDNKADGHGTVAQYTRSDVPGQNNEAWDHDGAGTCTDQNMNMPEGAKITFKVCVADFNPRKILSCSGAVTATA